MFYRAFVISFVFILGMIITSVSAHETLTREQRAEIRFMQGMVDHHQLALDMATHCLDDAETTDVRNLCQEIIDAQTLEIEQMQTWLLNWYNIAYDPVSIFTLSDEHTEDGHGTSHSNANPLIPDTDMSMTMGMMAGLNRYEDVDYDIAWVEAMIDHHDDAVHMAERMLTRFVHSELGEFAQSIIDAQTTQIVQMEALLPELELDHGN